MEARSHGNGSVLDVRKDGTRTVFFTGDIRPVTIPAGTKVVITGMPFSFRCDCGIEKEYADADILGRELRLRHNSRKISIDLLQDGMQVLVAFLPGESAARRVRIDVHREHTALAA